MCIRDSLCIWHLKKSRRMCFECEMRVPRGVEGVAKACWWDFKGRNSCPGLAAPSALCGASIPHSYLKKISRVPHGYADWLYRCILACFNFFTRLSHILSSAWRAAYSLIEIWLHLKGRSASFMKENSTSIARLRTIWTTNMNEKKTRQGEFDVVSWSEIRHVNSRILGEHLNKAHVF